MPRKVLVVADKIEPPPPAMEFELSTPGVNGTERITEAMLMELPLPYWQVVTECKRLKVGDSRPLGKGNLKRVK